MEFSINGHKVVGSGTVHTVDNLSTTFSSNFGAGSYYSWCVTNGICTVVFVLKCKVNNVGLNIGTVPTPKLNPQHTVYDFANNPSCMMITCAGGTFNVHNYAIADFYGTFSYPVADDWHE